MRALVTGGSGYLGSRLVAALAQRDDIDEVVNVDVREPRAPAAKSRFVRRSVTDDLRGTIAGADIAVHSAWVLDPLHDAKRQREICIGGTQRFLEACAAAGTPHVVFVSSDTAFGADPSRPDRVDDHSPLSERYHFQYSREKREAEELVRRFTLERPDTIVQVVRPSLIWGPDVSNYLSRLASKRVTFRVLGHDPEIQLIHQDDARDGIAAVIASRLRGPFNVAPPGWPLSRIFARIGTLAIPLPLRALVVASEVAWRLRLRFLTEAPGEFIYFIAFHPVLASPRLEREVGYRFQYETAGVMDAWLSSRSASPAPLPTAAGGGPSR